MVQIVEDKLSKIFNNYDFGFDVALVCSSEWSQDDSNKYSKKVYLECVESSYSTPVEKIFTVELTDKEPVISCERTQSRKMKM